MNIDGFSTCGAPWRRVVLLFGAQFGNIATEANIYPTHIRALQSASFAAARIGSGLYWLLDDMDLRLYLHARQMFALAAVPLGVG